MKDHYIKTDMRGSITSGKITKQNRAVQWLALLPHNKTILGVGAIANGLTDGISNHQILSLIFLNDYISLIQQQVTPASFGIECYWSVAAMMH